MICLFYFWKHKVAKWSKITRRVSDARQKKKKEGKDPNCW